MTHILQVFFFVCCVIAMGFPSIKQASAAAEFSADQTGEPIVVAQLFDRGFGGRDVHVYIDEYGRQVSVDRNGRILHIEEASRSRWPQRNVQPEDNWTLNGPVDNEPSFDGYGSVPEDPNYFPEAPPAPGYEYNRDGLVERSDLPPPGSYPNPDGSTASLEPGYERPDFDQPLAEPRAVPDFNDMAPAIEMPKGTAAKEKIAAFQVLLDRAGASPGVIDGRAGSNVDKAMAAYHELTGKSLNPNDMAAIQAELDATGGPAFMEYEISNEDVGRQYVASIPEDYAHKAQLPAMAYTSVAEMLAEKFHIDESYLKEINPGVNFSQPGSIIRVPNVGKPIRKPVSRIIADKGRKQVRGYDENGQLVVAYPATIGSNDNPSPSGLVEVQRIAINPNYTYNPKINFKQGNNDKVLTIPPGPNGPVGTVWIALSKPTYGIHGTPEPSRIGKTSSHGCVRLTNWDAEELAKLVKRGVAVEFID